MTLIAIGCLACLSGLALARLQQWPLTSGWYAVLALLLLAGGIKRWAPLAIPTMVGTNLVIVPFIPLAMLLTFVAGCTS